MKSGPEQLDNNHFFEQIKRKDWYQSYSTSANYTITDVDKIKTIFATAGSSADVTITLPTAADNIDRVIEIIKVDTGTKNIIIDGEGAETINGFTTIELRTQYDFLHIKCTGAGWYVMANKISYDTGWVSLADWTATSSTVTHNLNVQMVYLDVNLFWSVSGADGNDNYDFKNMIIHAAIYGQGTIASTADVIIFQTATNGGVYLNGAGGISSITTGYYRVMIKRNL